VASPIIEVTVDRLVIGAMEALEVALALERVPVADPLTVVLPPVVPRVTEAGGRSVYAAQVSFSYPAAARVEPQLLVKTRRPKALTVDKLIGSSENSHRW
jgi:hypothetical protein